MALGHLPLTLRFEALAPLQHRATQGLLQVTPAIFTSQQQKILGIEMLSLAIFTWLPTPMPGPPCVPTQMLAHADQAARRWPRLSKSELFLTQNSVMLLELPEQDKEGI